MRAAVLVVFLCAIPGLLPSKADDASSAASKKITSADVWQMPAQFITTAHNNCDKASPKDFSDCFIEQMSKAGAGPASVAFTRELYKKMDGEVGILTGLQAVGPVDIGWVTYPLRANTNYGLLFLNGDPRLVNVEDLKLLDKKTMEQSGQFQDTKGQFPKVDVWPGDRDGTTWPNSQPGPNGGIQFIVGYPLINGCHACAHAGSAIFTWNFDAKGKFLGTSFMGMTPPPLQ